MSIFEGFLSTSETLAAFSDGNFVAAMLRFEAALARAQAAEGLIPEAAAQSITGSCKVELFDVAKIVRESGRAGSVAIPLVKALGANPTPLAFPEVYAALEQKALDGQENPLNVILSNKFAEVQKHLAITNHQYNPQSLIFSKKVWDQLSGAEKKVLQDAAVEAAKFQRQTSRDAATSTLAELKKAGMQVTEFSAAEQAKLREKLKPVIDKHGAAIATTVAEMQDELAKARK